MIHHVPPPSVLRPSSCPANIETNSTPIVGFAPHPPLFLLFLLLLVLFLVASFAPLFPSAQLLSLLCAGSNGRRVSLSGGNVLLTAQELPAQSREVPHLEYTGCVQLGFESWPSLFFFFFVLVFSQCLLLHSLAHRDPPFLQIQRKRRNARQELS